MTRRTRREYTKGKIGMAKARAAYYKRFRNGNNRVNKAS